MRGRGRAGEEHARAQGVAHVEHRLRDVDLVGVQMARQALEIAQHLEAGNPEAARAYGGDRSAFAVRVADDVVGIEHDLREARRLHRAQLGLQRPRQRDRVHAEMVEVHK